MKNVFSVLFIIASLVYSTANASSSSSDEENLVTYRFKTRESFNNNLRRVCERPEVVGLDFTRISITDADLKALFNALVERESKLKSEMHHALSFIDLRFGKITEEGLLSFLQDLQEGHGSIRPDVRDTVFKIGLGISDELIDKMVEVAPTVFAGGVEIVQ